MTAKSWALAVFTGLLAVLLITACIRAKSASENDPRFSTCAEAKSHGLGPYHSNDPEYGWYEDRNNDGVVCE